MASFIVHLSLISAALMFSPLLSSSSHSHSNTKLPTLSTSPATLTDPPSSSQSPFQELSPDIAPLLPSPGGVLPSPTGRDIPTIPSSPSPPNPDDIVAAPGPFSAFSPFGAVQATSNAPISLLCNSVITVLAGLAALWLM